MRRTGVLIWILWMGLFGFTSCTDRLEEVEEQYTGENEVWVRLIVSRPYSGKEVRSKAGNDRETEIDEIQLLVFEEGGYKYRVPGISITNSGTTTSFSARLLATDKTLDLYIVAKAGVPPRWKFHYFTDVRTLPAGFRAGCELPARNQRCEHVKSCCPGRCVGRWDYEF